MTVTTGLRPASYGDLLSDVAQSKADEVQVPWCRPWPPDHRRVHQR